MDYVTISTFVFDVVLPWVGESGRSTVAAFSDSVTATVVMVFVVAATVGITAVGALQSLLGLVVSYALFGKEARMYLDEAAKGESDLDEDDDGHREVRREMARRWTYWVFIFVFAFVLAAGLEEALKFGLIVAASRFGRVQSEIDYVVVGVAGALGFALVEALGFVVVAVRRGERGLVLWLTVGERVLVGLSLHCMTAVLVAVGVVLHDLRHQERSVWQILWEPVLFHGVFDFVLLAICACDGHVGWVHPKRGHSLYLMLVSGGVIMLALGSVMVIKLGETGIVS